MMMMKFNEVLNVVKGSELTVLTEGKSYFTVENEEGFRAYCQAEVIGYQLDNENYYRGYSFSSTHRPNRKTGSGYRVANEVIIENEDQLLTMLNRAFEFSKAKVESGRESKDTRQPKNGFL